MSRSCILSILVLVCSTFAEEAKQDQTKANGVAVESTDFGVGDMKQGSGGSSYNCGRYGCCRYGRYGCQRCCRNAEEAKTFASEAETAKNTDTSDMGVGDMKQGSGGSSYNCGRYGCCRYGRYGCQRCCRNAEEAKAFASEAETAKNTDSSDMGVGDMKQGGGGGSYNCGRYGCCRYGRYECQRCCRNAEEAKAFASEAETAKNTDSSDMGVGDMKQGGGGGSYNCGRYGCCRYGRYGCQRCCRNAEEAKNFQENQAKN